MRVTTGRRIHGGEISVTKSAMPMLIGTATTNAISEMTTVPKENAKRPEGSVGRVPRSLVR